MTLTWILYYSGGIHIVVEICLNEQGQKFGSLGWCGRVPVRLIPEEVLERVNVEETSGCRTTSEERRKWCES